MLYKNIMNINQIQSIKEDPFLYSIYQKTLNNEEITENEALKLFESDRLLEIGFIANMIKKRSFQKKIFYIFNAHINYTNICTLKCSFCSFRRSKKDIDAYEMSLDQIETKFKEYNLNFIQEVHIVGGLHPKLPLSYYTDLLQRIKKINPKVNIKAFTAVEIDFFSKKFKKSIQEILEIFIKSGLGSIPGGGAEIFDEEIRSKICNHKTTGDQWLKIHKTAHDLNLKTNATMLFGHIENYSHRISHMKSLRDLQKKTNGFLAFIPLTYHPDNNSLKNSRTSIIDELKTIAISRIYLYNIPHIKAYWVMLGIKTAQIALNFGADDLDGTIKEEKIYHAAGSLVPQSLSEKELHNVILENNLKPVLRDSFYSEIRL